MRKLRHFAAPLAVAAALTTPACSSDPKDVCGIDINAGRDLIVNDLNALEEAGIELTEQIIDEVDRRTKSMLYHRIEKANCPKKVKRYLEFERDIAMSNIREQFRALDR